MLGCNFSRLLSLWEESWAKDKPLVRRVLRRALPSSFPSPRDFRDLEAPWELGLQLQGAVLLGLTPFPTPPPSLSSHLPPPQAQLFLGQGWQFTDTSKGPAPQNHRHASVKNTGMQNTGCSALGTDSCSPDWVMLPFFCACPFDTE